MQRKSLAAISLGLALLGYGLFLHWQYSQFLANAARTSAEIIRIRDDDFVTTAADVQPTSLRLHRCKYTVRFTPDQNEQIETQISQIAKSCSPKATTVQILYDKLNPSAAILYTLDSDHNSAGKMGIAFGMIILGITYFMWVGVAQQRP
jgi:hypothetical protein